jgi:hypothetical protein
MSEYAYHVERFRQALKGECEQASLTLKISHLDIARALQQAATEEMKRCIDDPCDVEQVKKLLEAARREIDDAIDAKS